MQRGDIAAASRHAVVLGASGLLGHVVFGRLLDDGGRVTGVMRRSLDDVMWWPPFRELPSGARLVDGVDATDWERLSALLDELAPDVIVNCVGLTPRRADAADAIAAIRVNALLPHLLAAWAAPTGCRLIHVSTDCVFGHEPGGFTETSPALAQDLYGRSKALGEVIDGAVTLRTSFVGRELCGGTELLDWFLGCAGGTVSGYADVWYSGVPVDTVAEVIARLAGERRDLVGLHHLAADEPISKLDLLRLADTAFSAGVTIVADSSFTSHRTLDGSRLRSELGLGPVDWEAALARLAEDRRYELRPHDRVAT